MSFEADPSIDRSEDPGGATPKPVIGPISTNVGELLGGSAVSAVERVQPVNASASRTEGPTSVVRRLTTLTLCPGAWGLTECAIVITRELWEPRKGAGGSERQGCPKAGGRHDMGWTVTVDCSSPVS